MTIELTGTVEEELRDLAAKQGRALQTLVEEAVQDYLVASAITDTSSEEVGEAQMAMMAELPGLKDTSFPLRKARPIET